MKTNCKTITKRKKSIRTIETIYYFKNNVVKRTKSKHVNSAVKNCMHHMQMNDYQATAAHVYDSDNGSLHAVITNRLVKGELVIETLFKSEIVGRKK